MRTPVRVAGGLLAAALVAGCASSGGSGSGSGSGSSPSAADTVTASAGPGGVQQVSIQGDDRLRFRPSTVVVAPGPVRVTYRTVGGTPHTFTVARLGVDTHTVDGGKSATVTFRVDAPGSYRFTCDFHPSMTGTLVVR